MAVRRLLGLLFTLLVTVAPAFAQQSPDPNAQIAWPLPTFVLSGSFSIYGTADVPGMTGYFLEFRPLIDSVTPAGDEVRWTPATLADRNPVVNGMLGVWDTTQVPDGLYELRLTIFSSGGQPIYARVSPLRVMNTLSPFMQIAPGAAAFPTALPPADSRRDQPRRHWQRPSHRFSRRQRPRGRQHPLCAGRRAAARAERPDPGRQQHRVGLVADPTAQRSAGLDRGEHGPADGRSEQRPAGRAAGTDRSARAGRQRDTRRQRNADLVPRPVRTPARRGDHGGAD